MAKRRGRPPKEFDLKQVQVFGTLGLTGIEMASLLGTSSVTISHRMTDPDSPFFKAYHLGYSGMKKSLRHKQIAMALSGSVPMLIWLGRVHLDQHEHPTTVISMTQNANRAPELSMEQFRAEVIAAETMAEAYFHEQQKLTTDGRDLGSL
jgi:hypothetical protein